MFRCPKCENVYQRKAHLSRHEITHTQQPASSCPVCKKAFVKPDVARRHSKSCARKHNQPLPPTGKPGRKRRSCDPCFDAKVSCDRNSPCSRCLSHERECTYTNKGTSRSGSPLPLSNSSPQPSRRDGPFSFLQRFANPSVQKDRLAIGETGKSSIRRNLEALHSHLEDALIPADPIQALFGDFWMGGAQGQIPPSTHENSLFGSWPDSFFPSKLSSQLTEIMTELVETSKSMGLTSEQQSDLDMMDLTALFGVSNISTIISTYFHTLHWYLPIVHFPTFDPGNVSNCLLLAIFLAGAAYSTALDGAATSSWVIDVAEEFIFRHVMDMSTNPPSTEPKCPLATVQLLQSALIIEMLQFARDEMRTRRRIRIVRHPCLVSAIRSLGLFRLKRRMAPSDCDGNAWKEQVAEEMCIRIACWAFLADGFLTVCFKNHPAISIFEMDCHFPWSADLWEAESATSFCKVAAAHSSETPLPPLRTVISQLLEIPNTAPIPWSLSISAEHLLISIYALNSLAFQHRAGLLHDFSLEKVKPAADNWKRIWDAVIGSLDKEQYLHLGYPKHAQELWWLLTATLDVTRKGGLNFPYLDSTGTDELGSLNDFIQWCRQQSQ